MTIVNAFIALAGCGVLFLIGWAFLPDNNERKAIRGDAHWARCPACLSYWHQLEGHYRETRPRHAVDPIPLLECPRCTDIKWQQFKKRIGK